MEYNTIAQREHRHKIHIYIERERFPNAETRAGLKTFSERCCCCCCCVAERGRERVRAEKIYISLARARAWDDSLCTKSLLDVSFFTLCRFYWLFYGREHCKSLHSVGPLTFGYMPPALTFTFTLGLPIYIYRHTLCSPNYVLGNHKDSCIISIFRIR